ncbi:hypothetical protein ACFQ1I_31855 [Kitasatospora arboriphila]
MPGHRGAGSLEAVLPFGPGDVWAVGSRSDPAAARTAVSPCTGTAAPGARSRCPPG